MKDKISILGSNTTIICDAIPPEQDAVALFIPTKNIIVIGDETFSSLTHELFHLLCHRSGVKQSDKWSDDLEEVLAENFSVMMDENFDDLIRLRKKLSKKRQKK